MKSEGQLPLLLAILSIIVPTWSQESWSLRFSVKEGLTLNWYTRITAKKIVDKQAEVEVTELWTREGVEKILPNGNLLWSSQAVKCIINGEVIPVEQMEKTVSELTPSGRPSRTIPFPPPSLNRLDDWLLDLFGGISLVLPLVEVKAGDKWQHQIPVGLKPPNEPRKLTVTYRLEDRDSVDGKDCLKISVKAQSPVKLAWEWKDASVIVSGGAKVEGVFWFDPDLGSVRRKRVNLYISYAVESERWDGFQFRQMTKFVNQTVEVDGRLLWP